MGVDLNDLLAGINKGLTQGLDAYNATRERQLREKQLDAQAKQMEAQTQHQMNMEKIGLLQADQKSRAAQSEEEERKARVGKLKAETSQIYEGKKPTEGQSQAALYAKRLEQAEGVFQGLQDKGYDRTKFSQGLLSYAPEALKPSDLKQAEQAERNFVNAILRKESGAAISPSEFANAEKQYFPRAGDSPEVLEQKKQNRVLAFEGLKVGSGKAYEKLGAQGLIASQPRQSPVSANASSGAPMAAEQAQAETWARQNPKDPRAQKILQMLGK